MRRGVQLGAAQLTAAAAVPTKNWLLADGNGTNNVGLWNAPLEFLPLLGCVLSFEQHDPSTNHFVHY